jgi:hypothetical protein
MLASGSMGLLGSSVAGFVEHARVRTREVDALPAVRPLDKIRRRAIDALHPEHERITIGLTYMVAPDDDPVSYLCVHELTSLVE